MISLEFLSKVFRPKTRQGGLPEEVRQMVRHNQRVWKPCQQTDGRVVLQDFSAGPGQLLMMSYVGNLLAAKHRAKLVATSSRWEEAEAKADGTLEIMESYGTRDYWYAWGDPFGEEERTRWLEEARSKIATKEDLLRYELDGLPIGEDIYESVLRYHNRATVEVSTDPVWLDVMEQAFGIYQFWRDRFVENEIVALLGTQLVYIRANILARLALKNDVPVYTMDGHMLMKADSPRIYGAYFKSSRTLFHKMSPEEQQNALEISRERLERRVKGEVGVDMAYSTASAFVKREDGLRVIEPSDRLKVLICTHDFFDAPHVYGGLPFPDFYEWIAYLGEISERTDYDWYIKTHPDPSELTENIIYELTGKYPKLQLLPKTTSHHELIEQGIQVCLTCHGTVTLEYPLFHVPVVQINRINPTMAYDFTVTCPDLKAYEEQLLNLAGVEVNFDDEEVYKAYFMRNYFFCVNDLFVEDYAEMITGLGGFGRVSYLQIYQEFVSGFSEQRHHETLERLKTFLDSGCRFLTRIGPLNEVEEVERSEFGK